MGFTIGDPGRRYIHPSSQKHYPLLPRRIAKPKRLRHGGKKSTETISEAVTALFSNWTTTTNLITGASSSSGSEKWWSPGLSNVKTYTRNPNWKVKVAKNLDASNPYSVCGTKMLAARYVGTVTGGNRISFIHGSDLAQHMVDDTADSALMDIALARLKNRLNGNIGHASLLPPLAESREIHGLVRQINGWALQMVKDLATIKRTRGKSAFKHAGQVWLFFGFGVNPLIADIAKAAQSIEDYKSRQDRSVSVHGSASKDWLSHTRTSGGDYNVIGVTGGVAAQASHQLSYRYKGAVDLKIGTASDYSMARHLGLSIGQLPSALWELTPYSWCLDYFTTIGPWLDDVFFTLPGSLKYLVRCQRYQMSATHSIVLTPANGYSVSYGGNTGFIEYYSFSRTPLTTLPTRQLRIRSFDEVAQYGMTKVLNLASVLAGRLKIPRV